MVDCNIIKFLEKVFNDKEAEELMNLYNEETGSNIHLALLPFVNHEAIKSALNKRVMRNRFNMQSNGDYSDASIYFLGKLDESNYWVDMTTIADIEHVEYNTVLECYRTVARDPEELYNA